MKTLYLGPVYSLNHIKGDEVSLQDVVDLLMNQNPVAIFQGRSEAGPRALGNRSLLYDPRDPNAKAKINTIKKREHFRPFAASVMLEHANDWFDLAGLKESPHMMYAMDCWPHQWDKIPGVLHVDKTCRIQTVTGRQNRHYYDLIQAFHKSTGVPMLFNTSFNLAGQPLVESPEDAMETFHGSEIPYLYFPEVGRLISK